MHFKCVGIYGILILMLQVLCKVSFTYFFSLFISNQPFAIPALDMIPLELTMDNRDLKKDLARLTKRTTTNISNMPAQSLGRDHYSLVKKGRENALL